MSPSVVKWSTQNKCKDIAYCWGSHAANFLFNSMFLQRMLFITLSASFNFSFNTPIFVLCSVICLSKSGVLHVSSLKLVLGSQSVVLTVSCTSLFTDADWSEWREPSLVSSFFFPGSGCCSGFAFFFFGEGPDQSNYEGTPPWYKSVCWQTS